MKLGAMDNVLGKSPAESFARAKQLGLAGVEVNLSVKPLVAGDTTQLDDIRRASDITGVAITSAVLGEHNSGGLATWWRGPEADSEVRAAVDAASALAARDLLVPFFFFNEPKGKAHRTAVAQRLAPLAEYAHAKGVRICFEGVLPAPHLLEIVQAVASTSFGIYYDPANATWCDYDIVAEVKLLSTHLFRSHVKEALSFTGDARLGRGRVDHTAYAAALKSIGYQDWLILETPGGTDAEIQLDIDFARKAYAALLAL